MGVLGNQWLLKGESVLTIVGYQDPPSPLQDSIHTIKANSNKVIGDRSNLHVSTNRKEIFSYKLIYMQIILSHHAALHCNQPVSLEASRDWFTCILQLPY